MARFQVDSNEVASAAAITRQYIDAIRQDVAALMGHLNSLQGTWVGAASGAFAGAATQWRATQSQVETSLAQISTQLDQASQVYAEAELAASSLFTF